MLETGLKRIVVLLTIVVLILTLGGCGATTKPQTINDESTVNDTRFQGNEDVIDNGIADTDRIEDKNAGTGR